MNRIVAASGVLVAVVLACSGPGPDEASPAPTTSPAESASSLVEGRHFGFIRAVAVEATSVELSFDLAEFLTGDDANRAAREDGRIGAGETVENDYHIRNRNDRLRTLGLASDAVVVVVRWDDCCETVPADRDAFVAAFAPGADRTGRYKGPDSQYWLTVSSGRVTRVEEQFLP